MEYRQLDRVVKWNRAFFTAVATFGAVWSVVVITAGYWFWMPVAVAGVAAIWLMTWRMERLAIVAEADELVVTNVWREHRLCRADIGAFAIETTFMRRRRSLAVKLRDFTTVHCDVMGPTRGERTRSDIEACRAALTAWLTPEA